MPANASKGKPSANAYALAMINTPSTAMSRTTNSGIQSKRIVRRSLVSKVLAIKNVTITNRKMPCTTKYSAKPVRSPRHISTLRYALAKLLTNGKYSAVLNTTTAPKRHATAKIASQFIFCQRAYSPIASAQPISNRYVG